MSKQIKAMGSCLCNKVTIRAEKVTPHVDACHCDMCRKWSGGPSFNFDCGTDVSFGGEGEISIYDSSEWAERGFCKHCGTHLFYRLKQNQQHIIPAGLLNIESLAEFETQIFIDEKPDYYDFANTTKNMTGEQVFAAFAAE